jgi:hypothetical protein
MRRIYFLVPDQESCRRIVAELEASGVPQHHLHVVASMDQVLEDLPEASAWQKTELKHGIEIGVGLGASAGLLSGLLALAFPPGGLILGGGAVLAMTAAGAGYGTLVSALMKGHEQNHRVHDFEPALMRGELLLMVDIPRHDLERAKALVLEHHPEAEIGVVARRAAPSVP